MQRRDDRMPRPEMVRCVFVPCSRPVLYRVQRVNGSSGVDHAEMIFTCDLHPMRVIREDVDGRRFVVTKYRAA